MFREFFFWKLEGNFKGVLNRSIMFQHCFKETSSAEKVDSKVFQASFKDVSKVFQGSLVFYFFCFMAVIVV